MTIVTRAGKGSSLTWDEMDANLLSIMDAATIHASTAKTTPVDLDETLLLDSVAAFGLKKLTWADKKATLKTYFDTIYQTAGSYLTSTDIGVTIQGYDANTAKTNVTQTNWVPQRTQETLDNDGSFDLNAALDFQCTPTGATVLTFTNIPATPTVQKGSLIWVNTTSYAVTAHANTKISSTLLTTLSATGTYLVSYRTSNGVCYVSATGALV